MTVPFTPFFKLFREVADHETRTVTRWGDPDLPDATYGFLELFCDEKGCDCRRAHIWVISKEVRLSSRTPLATISYGWEDDDYYNQWASFPLTAEDLDEMKGPALVSFAPQSRYSTRLLEIFESLLEDEAYVRRLVRHYEMFREVIDRGVLETSARKTGALKVAGGMPSRRRTRKPKRRRRSRKPKRRR